MLKHGGILCAVVKAFNKNEQIVDYPLDTLKCLEATGFEDFQCDPA
jgi:hypothetical protein